MLFEKYSESQLLSEEDIQHFIKDICSSLNISGESLIIPPDYSRLSSGAGNICRGALQ